MGRTKAFIAVAIAAALVAGALGAGTAVAKPKKGPTVVGTDPEGDWGSNVDPTVAPGGDVVGSDLTEATIQKADATTLNFIIKVAALTPNGGPPEAVRYVWTLAVDGELIQLDGKWTNYTRGTCDPTAGTCPPPRDPGQAPFLVRGECTSNGGTAVTCTELGLVHGTFDVETSTITIPVPLEMMNAKVGSVITTGTQPDSGFTGVWAIPSAWASQASMPKDELIIVKSFTVPKK